MNIYELYEQFKIETNNGCPKFDSCSVNNCPLCDTKQYTDSGDKEKVCTLSKKEVQQIKSEHRTLNKVQISKVTQFLKTKCCNYENGFCALLENAFKHKCPRVGSDSVRCSWFREFILPSDKVLEVEINSLETPQEQIQVIQETRETSKYVPRIRQKQCDVCGKTFTSIARNTKHCPKCAEKVKRKQKAEFNRKRRQRQKRTKTT